MEYEGASEAGLSGSQAQLDVTQDGHLFPLSLEMAPAPHPIVLILWALF